MHWGHKVAARGGPVEVTRKEYNEQAGAETPEQPSVPACGEHVWRWWWELNTRRPPGFDNLAPISYGEIYAWILLLGKYVSPEEIGWLVQMDNAWMTAIAEERKARQEREREEADRKRSK